MPAIGKRRGGVNPTVDQIETDRLTRIANEYWAPFSSLTKKPYEPRLIDDIYTKEINGTLYNVRRIMLLEYSQYLECYLWPNFNPDASTDAHLMSIVVIVNEKFRERVPAWTSIKSRPDIFPGFFNRVMSSLLKEDGLSYREQTALVIFVIHCFNSVEVDMVRLEIQKLVSLPIWSSILPARRESELKKSKKLTKFWALLERKMLQADEKEKNTKEAESQFLWNLCHRFLQVLESVPQPLPSGEIDRYRLRYCERVLELLTDLEALLPTRRFFNVLLHSSHVVVKCSLSELAQMEEGHLFRQLLDRLKFYSGFEINDFTGEALTDNEMLLNHYNDFTSLQKATFSQFGAQLNKFSLANVGSVDTRAQLHRHFKPLANRKLHQIASHLHLVGPPAEEEEEGKVELDSEFLLEVLVTTCQRRTSQLEALNEMPLYPTEEIVWDENIVPSEYYSGEGCLALPKLNLQFLTLHDYLLRNFTLFRLESTYEIREDIQDNVIRMKPFKAEDVNVGTVLGGWARMAQSVVSFSIVEVAKPNIGHSCPSSVRADVAVNLSTRREIREEWDGIRKHDVMFLVTVRAKNPIGTRYDYKKPFIPQVGLSYVRGCEVEGMLDEQGRVIEEGPEPPPKLLGQRRTYRVWLDCNQYQQDMQKTSEGQEDVYETFNILMRRKPKENNFKAVLETIRNLMNTECVVPNWLLDIILGYGDPGAAHYSKMKQPSAATMDFNDTFMSLDHLKTCFPDHEAIVATEDDVVTLAKPPFRLTFPDLEEDEEEEEEEKKPEKVKKKKKKGGKKRAAEKDSSEEPAKKKEKNENEEEVTEVTEKKEEPMEAGSEVRAIQRIPHKPKPKLIVQPYVVPSRGPYPFLIPKKNTVPFTPTQIEAIRSGMQHGLTMVVGPPGTGKTDVAVQIISNIYHNFPNERTLIITHSNQALNQLFEKVMALDIDERHLLRMGRGEEMLATEKDFSKYGRVNYVLAHRLELLEEVGRLQQSLDVPGDVTYTCETAGHFYLHQVLARWEAFHLKLTQLRAKVGREVVDAEGFSKVAAIFPFNNFFANAVQPLFPGKTTEEDVEVAEGCYRYIKKIFEQLEEYRAFELLRTGADRAKYLLIKEAKVIAMTCTHAALKRSDFVKAGFKYDNVLMEESAQILEIETFIPLLLQNPELNGSNRLKRWIMIGDHHQLPPVIKNMSFQKYSNMEQSLFTRFVRLGVPTVDLDAQGRARPTISGLYSWRYKKLGNLPHIYSYPEFKVANAGFFFDHQVINVEDFNGVGESEPNPHFYQNLAEAEFIVATYMYMRVLGYPSEKISILTTYNGQKHLLRDVLHRRCANNPMLGFPAKVTTVDRFQGQQNDYILLSLVRTRTVGHLRDVRRLIVAMSRARLGLYIFGRVSLFRNCYELTPAFSQLCARPMQLHLAPWELFPTQRPWDAEPKNKPLIIEDMPHMAQFVFDMYSQKINFMSERIAEEKARVKETWEPPKEKEKVKPKEIEKKKEEVIVNEVDDAEDIEIRMGLKKKKKKTKPEEVKKSKDVSEKEEPTVMETDDKEGTGNEEEEEIGEEAEEKEKEVGEEEEKVGKKEVKKVGQEEVKEVEEEEVKDAEEKEKKAEEKEVEDEEKKEIGKKALKILQKYKVSSVKPKEKEVSDEQIKVVKGVEMEEVETEDNTEAKTELKISDSDVTVKLVTASSVEEEASSEALQAPPPGEEGHVEWMQKQEEERERKEMESKEMERKEMERKETERRETERKETERNETERKETESKDTERKETERKETERKETERKETERKETERKETERKETERKETERREEEDEGKKDKKKDGDENEDEDEEGGAGPPLDEVVDMEKVIDKEEVEKIRREEAEDEEDVHYNPMEEHPGAASDSDEDIS